MLLADEARAEDHVGPAVEDRLQERGVVGRVVFQVGILNQHHGAGRLGEARAKRGALALVHSPENRP